MEGNLFGPSWRTTCSSSGSQIRTPPSISSWIYRLWRRNLSTSFVVYSTDAPVNFWTDGLHYPPFICTASIRRTIQEGLPWSVLIEYWTGNWTGARSRGISCATWRRPRIWFGWSSHRLGNSLLSHQKQSLKMRLSCRRKFVVSPLFFTTSKSVVWLEVSIVCSFFIVPQIENSMTLKLLQRGQIICNSFLSFRI